MPSTHIGHGAFMKSALKPTCLPIRIRRCTEGNSKLPLSRLSLANGVGNNPNAVPAMGRANVGSRYAMPFRIKPERGQRSEYVANPSIKQLWTVFHDDKSGSNLANKASELTP